MADVLCCVVFWLKWQALRSFVADGHRNKIGEKLKGTTFHLLWSWIGSFTNVGPVSTGMCAVFAPRIQLCSYSRLKKFNQTKYSHWHNQNHYPLFKIALFAMLAYWCRHFGLLCDTQRCTPPVGHCVATWHRSKGLGGHLTLMWNNTNLLAIRQMLAFNLSL